MTEKHLIEIEENEKVSAVHHESNSDKWIFFCHGFGSDKEGSYKIRCERAVEEGWNAVRFDFRGNGGSDGDFIDQNLSSKMNDLKTVIDFFEPGSYVLFGMSFGGKVVFHSAPELEPEAVIGKSPVTYNEIMEKFRSVVEEKGEYTHFGGKTIDHRFVDDLEENKFREVTEQLEVPVVFYHGREDTTVHPEYTWEAAQNLEKNTRVEMFEGEEHKMSDAANSKVLNSMFQWLESI